MMNIAITDVPNDIYTLSHFIDNTDSKVRYEDLSVLNALAVDSGAEIDLIKVSFGSLPEILNSYVVLPVGATFSYAEGPKIIRKKGRSLPMQPSLSVPGKQTSAYVLARCFGPAYGEVFESSYKTVLQDVKTERADLGLLIHELNFDLEQAGCEVYMDLGAWWRDTYQLPLPLGGLVARRSLGATEMAELVKQIQASLRYAQKNHNHMIERCMDLCAWRDRYSLERSIEVWINEDTIWMSDEAKMSIQHLIQLKSSVTGFSSLSKVFHL
ncbi:MAG: hypothetical protein OXT67_08115 [Zetaproteobacteria bacterium]|nr:hypothetical protein [Zetaproteobacteria bacterium]